MIEIRNDEIGDRSGERKWADRLAYILFAATPGLFESSHAMVNLAVGNGEFDRGGWKNG
jgi:predicted N-formylglutamate amidohydrolase